MFGDLWSYFPLHLEKASASKVKIFDDALCAPLLHLRLQTKSKNVKFNSILVEVCCQIFYEISFLPGFSGSQQCEGKLV